MATSHPKYEKVGSAQVCDPKRPTTCVFAGSGRKRFEFMRLPGEKQEGLLDDATLWELLQPWGWTKVGSQLFSDSRGSVIQAMSSGSLRPQENCTVERKVIYTFRARWATEFSKGRVTLAGDALHLMPPFIGQGPQLRFPRRRRARLASPSHAFRLGPARHSIDQLSERAPQSHPQVDREWAGSSKVNARI